MQLNGIGKEFVELKNLFRLLRLAFVNPEKFQLKLKKAGGKQAKHRLYA
jgi:hypothetical protein